MGNFSDRGVKQSIDWKLVISYLLLILIGWVNIYASIHSSEPSSIFDFNVRSGKQFVWILTALALALLILFAVNPRFWESSALPLYLFVLVLLVVVIFVSKDVKGSHSWFEFGPVKFQPAEISKITTSLLLATLMSQTNYRVTRFKDFMMTALIIGIPMLVILAESETGSALVYVGFLFVMYREGFSGWWIFSIIAAILLFILTLTASPYVSLLTLMGLVAIAGAIGSGQIGHLFWINLGILVVMSLLPLIFGKVVNPESFMAGIKPMYILLGVCVVLIVSLFIKGYRERKAHLSLSALAIIAGIALVFSTDFIFNNILQDHQRKRIEVLLGMKEDPSGVGYNVNQSMIAIGSGGFKGKGFLNGTQTTFGFVPEQSTDFIFCTVGEEWGFIGCLVVILLYVFMIWRIIIDAEKSREAFTRIYGYCVASCIFMHLFINIGMTIGLMPVIGIPLPLLSYGGSSLWAFTVLIFIFIALYRQEKKYY
ncbi:MAG: rod shape-determining protein RodA [Bacteroidales bacterium]|nr:rod shape-determining protein RodA [Bacteroidales bacterium]